MAWARAAGAEPCVGRDLRSTLGWLLLATLVVLPLTVPFFAPLGVIVTTDERTSLEMTLGIIENGVPARRNGNVDEMPFLAAPWNYAVHGKVWGMYPPGYPY